MIVDLHNHTTLCNHASGSVDEYIQQAIKHKTKYFGFSDHAPMNFDPKYRMNFNQMSMYENMIKKAQVKYKNQINILLAYEVDYIEGLIDEKVLSADVDYLIGSVHYIKEWGFDNPEFIGNYEEKNIDQIWKEYFDAIENMAKSGHFDIVGHIDLIKIFKFMPKKDIRLIAKNALKAIKKADMTIELNVSGYRKPIGESYPSDLLLEVISELEIPITFGSDSHSPEHVSFKNDEIILLAHKYGYTQCATFRKRERSMIKF
jgi:histidinol-phosphatase (PHP family)